MNRDEVADALAGMTLMALRLAPESTHQRLWTVFHDTAEGLELTRSEVCHAIYEASGPSMVVEYAETIGHDAWGFCRDCDMEVPIMFKGTPDALCLVCWADLSLLEGSSAD